DAMAFFAGRDRPVVTSASAANGPASTSVGHPTLRFLPWAVAAASLLVLLWSARAPSDVPPAEARAALLRSNATVVKYDLQPGASPRRGDVAGDIVWDGERQQGFLRVRGLPTLDPQHRYQLWIVDATRPGPPVDGGLLELSTDPGE